MTQTKFTPAPWKVTHGTDSTNVYAEKEWICELDYETGKSEANANLIAQAPAMYEAMAGFVHDFEGDYVMDDGRIVDNPHRMLQEIYHSFKSILSAARGETTKP